MGILDGRTAVVTGGARGIGAAVVRRFAAEGAAVVINDLGGGTDGSGSDAGPAEELAAEIRAAGGRAVADGGDVSDTAVGERLVQTAVDEFGGLDVLVNSAGVLRDRMIFNMSDDEWDTVIRVHLRGHFSTCRAAAAHFRSRRDPDGAFRIVNFTSHSGLEGSPGQANYAAAKMGIAGLTYSLAQGLARYGVTANAIAPAAATRLVATVDPSKRAIQDRPADDDPSRSPDNIAELALYLASPRSGWLTGRVLGSMGFSVDLYENPTVVASATSDGPWSFDDLAAQLEEKARPLADGLPRSLFADQATPAVTGAPEFPEFPTAHAHREPGRAAVIDTRTGATLTYGALEDRSRAVAHRLWDLGLRPGDHVALAVGNRAEFFEFCWAAHRIGLYYTAVNTHLTPGEAHYVVADCGAAALLVDDAAPDLSGDLPDVRLRLTLDRPRPGHEDYDAIAAAPTGPLPHEGEGERMLYTSGTTGRPKGVARPLTDAPPGSVFLIRPLMLRMGFDASSVLVNPAPLYHAAPSGYGMGVHRLGGTVLIDGRFDPARCLAAIESHRATHGLFVPTMFARMLRLPDRERYDVSSLVTAAHGAAPCPVSVKRAMIDWWGPTIVEYYGGTEGAGLTMIDSATWLERPGSVGRPAVGAVHILDPETGEELGPGRTGNVYFTGGAQFRYHNDDAKTAEVYDAHGRNTLGDIGHVDDDGYLYLTDRASFTVISGGVNVYPAEAENVLAGHPSVADVAAFGEPDPDLGESLLAVVELVDPALAGDATARELDAWCAERLARQKCPRRIVFTGRLPRTDVGKIAKRELRAAYVPAQDG